VPTWQPPRNASDAASLHFVLAPGRLPRGRRVYAIGDVHGCLDKLQQLHAAIADDIARRPASAVLVHLGDYIDFGPDSAGVIQLLAAGPIAGAQAVNLRGDHEHTALAALSGDGAAATDWLYNGGGAALQSWGISPDRPRDEWRAAIPPAHIEFLNSLRLSHREGDYLFAHAGINPRMAIDRQDEDDLLTIRQSFLANEQHFGVVVVHGHSTHPTPVLRPNRIGIDTGAGHGGPLTCAVLEEDAVAFLSV
jgi:serine/threonine protein phosphatase 1